MSLSLAPNEITLDKISHHFESGDKVVRLFKGLSLTLESGWVLGSDQRNRLKTLEIHVN